MKKTIFGKALLLVFLFVLVAAFPGFAQKVTVKKQTLYSYGGYSVYQNEDDSVSFWRDGGEFAIEFILGSNGYWNLYADGSEYTVWSEGSLSDGGMYNWPWEEISGKPTVLKDGTAFSTTDEENTTKFSFSKNVITVTMSDNGIITIPANAATVNFNPYDDSGPYSFPDQIAEMYQPDEEGDYSGEGDYVPELFDVGLIGRRVKVTDLGKIYPLVNTTELLSWPDEETKTLSGSNSWGKWKAKKNDVGTVIWQSQHPDSGVVICLVIIGGNYVAIAETGLETVSDQIDAVPFIESYHGNM